MKNLKDNLDDGLIATSLCNQEDGIAIAEYNSSLDATLAYNDIVNYTIKKFRDHNVPNINKYMIFNLENDKTLIIIPLDIYRWTILVDDNKIKLGVLLKIVIPQVREKFKSVLL
jgi:hypothetical protein